MELDMVADMEVDKLADMVAGNEKIIIDINMEIQFGEGVGHGVGFEPKLTRLAHLVKGRKLFPDEA